MVFNGHTECDTPNCFMNCEYGYMRDVQGCAKCACKPPPRTESTAAPVTRKPVENPCDVCHQVYNLFLLNRYFSFHIVLSLQTLLC